MEDGATGFGSFGSKNQDQRDSSTEFISETVVFEASLRDVITLCELAFELLNSCSQTELGNQRFRVSGENRPTVTFIPAVFTVNSP